MLHNIQRDMQRQAPLFVYIDKISNVDRFSPVEYMETSVVACRSWRTLNSEKQLNNDVLNLNALLDSTAY